MKPVPATYNAVLQSLRGIRSEAEILELVREQLERDLLRGGHPLELSGILPNIWIPALAHHLNLLPDDRLTSLLYLIDMPETLIRQMDRHSEDGNELASAVLYREMVKVYYKLHYS